MVVRRGTRIGGGVNGRNDKRGDFQFEEHGKNKFSSSWSQLERHQHIPTIPHRHIATSSFIMVKLLLLSLFSIVVSVNAQFGNMFENMFSGGGRQQQQQQQQQYQGGGRQTSMWAAQADVGQCFWVHINILHSLTTTT